MRLITFRTKDGPVEIDIDQYSVFSQMFTDEEIIPVNHSQPIIFRLDG